MERKTVVGALQKVLDPEIGIDIVTLGLIYKLDIKGSNVDIDMTLTFPGCPLAGYIAGQAKSSVEAIPEIGDVNVNLVFEPAWKQDLISEENYKKLIEE